MRIRALVYVALSLVISTLVAACGGSDSSTMTPVYESVTTATYKIEYIPVTTAVEGKVAYKLRLTNKTTGAAVAGKTITLKPTMTMTSMSHATPFEALSNNGDGTYSGIIYYVMASIAADGTSMGTWNLEFSVDSETATFHPSVAMAMGNIVKLKGVNDKIGSMMGSSPRTYQIFNDGIAGSTVKLFITAVDDSIMMTFPAVSVGTTLHNQMSAAVPVTTMTVEVSTDKATWTSLTDGGNGHWSATGLGMLTAGSHLYVRVTVNGEQKTTNGFAPGTADATGTPMAAGTTNEYGDLSIAAGM